jgi:hypothetical protein
MEKKNENEDEDRCRSEHGLRHLVGHERGFMDLLMGIQGKVDT